MKVKYSALVSDMRGKLNGSVASKNRYGSYFRNKITPSNPQTIDQVLQRSRLATFSGKWKTLTEAQRKAWNEAVSQYTSTNIFGDVVTPSGNILFNKINLNLATIGKNPINLPPLPEGAGAPKSVEVSSDMGSQELEITLEEQTVPSGLTMVVEATEAVSPGISYVKNKYRIIKTDGVLTAGVENIYADYVAKFGEPTPGLKIFVRVSYYNDTTGEKSLPVANSVIVA